MKIRWRMTRSTYITVNVMCRKGNRSVGLRFCAFRNNKPQSSWPRSKKLDVFYSSAVNCK